MTRIVWDSVGERVFETGVDRAVIYPHNGPGVPWNGLTDISEKFDGITPRPFYIDGTKFNEEVPYGGFSATLSAFTYPEVLLNYQGFRDVGSGLYASNQRRTRFNLTYRTMVGDDIYGIDRGYKIHLVYNALVTPSDNDFSTINGSPEASTFKWDLSTIPVKILGIKPTSHFILYSEKTDPYVLAELESRLYGDDSRDAYMLDAEDLMELLNEWSDLIVYDHGDGSWTARSSGDSIVLLEDGEFYITSDSAEFINADQYTLTSR